MATKKDLIDRVSASTGYTKKDVTPVVASVFDEIQRICAEGGDLAVVGFGRFYTVEREEREYNTPQGTTVLKPKRTIVKFKPGSAFADAVSGVTKEA